MHNYIKDAAKGLDNLFTSDEERLDLEVELEKAQLDYDLKKSKMINSNNLAQIEINKIDAKSGNFFQAGWRPALAWACVAGFVQYVVATSFEFTPIKIEILLPILMTLIGARSLEKTKKVDTKWRR